MQKVSKAYRESMKKSFRNRSYINITIGVVNQKAQKTAYVDDETILAYFANRKKPFDSIPVDGLYATAEERFSKVDGSMFFLPRRPADIIKNNGIVSEDLLGSVLIKFDEIDLDIKGLTIDFGECYPVDFVIENDTASMSYTGNTLQRWSTEDVFYETSFLKITPMRMVNGLGRLRIHELIFGIGNVFTNKNIKKYTFKDVVSPISESLPSQDMSLTVFNYDGKYNADNPDSALNFMEIGQEVSASFGYDITGNGDIEWIDGNEVYLKSWSANDEQAKFTATDRFDYLSGKFYKGMYRVEGISLFELAEQVFADAEVNKEEYFIDPYLENVIVYNPLPPVTYAEALQLIANAGRCILFGDRSRRIHLQSSFVPDMTAESNGETFFSNVKNVLVDDAKDAYALASEGFSKVDNSIVFLPRTENYLNTGYISDEVANEDGTFQNVPKIIVNLEAGFISYGLLIKFRNVAPKEFVIKTFFNDEEVQEITVQDAELEYISHEMFYRFNKMVISFTKGSPLTRITVDNILIGDVTNYTLTYNNDLTSTPSGTRLEKIQSISVQRQIYETSSDDLKELVTDEIVVSAENAEYTIYFSKAVYDLEAVVVDNESITCEIIDYSNYFVRLKFFDIAEELTIKFLISGKEFSVKEHEYSNFYNTHGEAINWVNPLISTLQHAKDLEEWLASYYLGDMEYSLKYRGNPEFDANDLFYLELKNREAALIRACEHSISFGGALSGTIKARKAVL